MGLITLVGLMTIGLSTYLILYSHWLYDRLAPLLAIFQKRTPFREASAAAAVPSQVDAVVIGLGRLGHHLAVRLMEHGSGVLGVDFDPQVVRQWCNAGRAAQYGDVEDPELTAQLPLANIRWVISTIPYWKVNRQLLHSLRERNFAGKVAVTAHSHQDKGRLEQLGADLVLMPFVDAAEEAVDMILLQDKRPDDGAAR
jgi:voltage-gated potassium channel Kch